MIDDEGMGVLQLKKDCPCKINPPDLQMLIESVTRCESRGRAALANTTAFALQIKTDVEIWGQAKAYMTDLMERAGARVDE